MANEDNGSGGDRPNGVQRVTVTMDAHTLKLGVDIDTLDLDVALSLLERAHREIEARYRFNRARELSAELIAAQQKYALVRNAMRDPRIKA